MDMHNLAWSPDGAFLFAAGTAPLGFLWKWVWPQGSPAGSQPPEKLLELSGQERAAQGVLAAAPRSQWPPAVEHCQLRGHTGAITGAQVIQVRLLAVALVGACCDAGCCARARRCDRQSHCLHSGITCPMHTCW